MDINKDQFILARETVIDLANCVVTNYKEREVLIEVIKAIAKESIKDNNTAKNTIRHMLSPINDGLAYGNWPWIKNGENILDKMYEAMFGESGLVTKRGK